MRAAKPSGEHRCREGVKDCRIMGSLRTTGFRGLARNKAVSETKDSRKGTVFAARIWPQVERVLIKAGLRVMDLGKVGRRGRETKCDQNKMYEILKKNQFLKC